MVEGWGRRARNPQENACADLGSPSPGNLTRDIRIPPNKSLCGDSGTRGVEVCCVSARTELFSECCLHSPTTMASEWVTVSPKPHWEPEASAVFARPAEVPAMSGFLPGCIPFWSGAGQLAAGSLSGSHSPEHGGTRAWSAPAALALPLPSSCASRGPPPAVAEDKGNSLLRMYMGPPTPRDIGIVVGQSL